MQDVKILSAGSFFVLSEKGETGSKRYISFSEKPHFNAFTQFRTHPEVLWKGVENKSHLSRIVENFFLKSTRFRDFDSKSILLLGFME